VSAVSGLRFLIAYSSRYGSTEEIALRLAGLPVEEGVDAIVLDVKKNSSWPSLEGYDGVIMGSGVKITRWMREPLEFLRRKKDEFRGRRLALFVSCMSVLTDSDYAWEELLEGVMERAGVEADLYEAFGPLVDMGDGSRMGFPDRRIARSMMVGLSGELGLELDMGGGTISGTGIRYGISRTGSPSHCTNSPGEIRTPLRGAIDGRGREYRRSRATDARRQ
jgi:menaquinone-dependent protoporphyrinogen IX oxidase